jgi:hypothetical protein
VNEAAILGASGMAFCVGLAAGAIATISTELALVVWLVLRANKQKRRAYDEQLRASRASGLPGPGGPAAAPSTPGK